MWPLLLEGLCYCDAGRPDDGEGHGGVTLVHVRARVRGEHFPGGLVPGGLTQWC